MDKLEQIKQDIIYYIELREQAKTPAIINLLNGILTDLYDEKFTILKELKRK